MRKTNKKTFEVTVQSDYTYVVKIEADDEYDAIDQVRRGNFTDDEIIDEDYDNTEVLGTKKCK